MIDFEWDREKELTNIQKHGVDFWMATRAFSDPRRKIYVDLKHADEEVRYFCIGMVDGRLMTVRFIYRGENIRIFGAGYWRKGRLFYEEEKK